MAPKSIRLTPRKRKSGKSGKLPPFVSLTWNMLNSMAYLTLTASSAKALPYFIGKPHINLTWPEAYQTSFKFTYGEAKRLGFATSTFRKVIEELMRKGFIDPVWKGGLRGDGKSANQFCLSKRWEKYGKGGFEEIKWREFITPSVF